MPSLIRDRASSSAQMLAVFDDDATLRAALAFEAALAEASAAEGVISADDAKQIAAACAAYPVSAAELAEEAAFTGTLTIPLVKHLRAQAGAAGKSAHVGATSQDVSDTVMILQAKQGLALIETDLARMSAALAALARTHAQTPMLGRTLMQAARPISFGHKVAQWMLAVDAARARLTREGQDALVIEFGGAAGTRADLKGKGAAIGMRLAKSLGLGAALPWHTRRDAVAGLASALAITAGSLAKIAKDIALMAQSEVGEAAEPRQEGRGGSSAMPHKRNATSCQVVLSAALRTPGLAASILTALPQEHERGMGGWQIEGPVLAELFELTHGAVALLTPVIEELELYPEVMAANLAAADVGDDLGESAALVASALEIHGRG